MSGWRRVPLGEIASLVSGVGFPKHLQGRLVGDYPVSKVGDISRAVAAGSVYVLDDSNWVDEADLAVLKGKPIPADSTVFAKIGEAVRLNRRAMLRRTSLVDNNVMAATPDTSRVIPKYLYWWLRTVDLSPLTQASAVPSVRKSDVARLEVPLPSLDRQTQVVARLEELFSDIDAGVDSTERVRRLLPAAHASLLDAAFSGLLSAETMDAVSGLPRGWRWTTLGDTSLTTIEAGLTKNPRRESLPDRLPYLRVANVYENELRLDEIKTIGVTESEARQKALQAGDLLVVEGNGSRDQIGRVALWDGSIAPVVHQNHIIRVRFDNAVNPEFALYWLMSARGRSAVVERASTTSGLYTLSKSKVSSLPLPVTDRATQDRIVAVVEAELSRLDALGRYVADARRTSRVLRQSVLAAAFSGQLV